MRLKDENADLKRMLEELEEKHKYANRQFCNVISNNVISNNCSPFSHRLHPQALQRAGNRNREAHRQRNRKKHIFPVRKSKHKSSPVCKSTILKCHFE